MAKSKLGSTQRSQHLGYGYKPRSKLDLFNPGQDNDANQEVVAFLNWLDKRKHITDAFDELDKSL